MLEIGIIGNCFTIFQQYSRWIAHGAMVTMRIQKLFHSLLTANATEEAVVDQFSVFAIFKQVTCRAKVL